MNRFKRLSITGILTLTLASTTLAGNIHTGVVGSSPPPPDNPLVAGPQTSTTKGEIDIGLALSDLDTAFILNLLQMLSVY